MRRMTWAAVIWVVCAPPVHAYLDPGTGSFLIQILVGSLVTAGVLIRRFWIHIMTFVRKIIRAWG